MVDVCDVHRGRRRLVCKQRVHRVIAFLLARPCGRTGWMQASRARPTTIAPPCRGRRASEMGARALSELQEVIRHHAAGFVVARGDVATAAGTTAVHEDAGDEPGCKRLDIRVAEAGALNQHTVDSPLLDQPRVRVWRNLTLAGVLREHEHEVAPPARSTAPRRIGVSGRTATSPLLLITREAVETCTPSARAIVVQAGWA